MNDPMQLMWEGYHSVETVSKWFNLPVHYLNEQFAAYCKEKEAVDI
jgi:hypothetical protein